MATLREKVAAVADGLTGADAAVLREVLARWDQVPANGDATTAAVAEKKAATPIKYARVDLHFLESFMRDTFEAIGAPPEEAAVAAQVLIWADRHGVSSHGCGRLKPIYVDRIRAGIMTPTASFDVVSETETTAVIDGNCGLGLYIGPRAMDICIEKAKKQGIAMVVVRNSTHYGAAGYYADKAQSQGCIGITGTNARPSIAPTFGVQPMLGTNPLTWGIPTDEAFPFILDCATSVNQRGKIEKYAREGKPTPPGQVVDRTGAVRTDTDGILKDLVTGQCSLAPLGGVGVDMGGYKGYGYATVVELLSSALCEGKTSPELTGVDPVTGAKAPMPLCHFFIAIDITRFLPLENFKARTGKFLRSLRESEKDPRGPGRIYTAGELEHEGVKDCDANGGTNVPEPLQRDMLAVRDMFDSIAAKYPNFSFED